MKTEEIDVGTIQAHGYIIRKAKVRLVSSKEIQDPNTPVAVEIIADLVWINEPNDSWAHSRNVSMTVDLDSEKFILNGQEIEIINHSQIFNRVIRALAGLICQ